MRNSEMVTILLTGHELNDVGVSWNACSLHCTVHTCTVVQRTATALLSLYNAQQPRYYH